METNNLIPFVYANLLSKDLIQVYNDVKHAKVKTLNKIMQQLEIRGRSNLKTPKEKRIAIYYELRERIYAYCNYGTISSKHYNYQEPAFYLKECDDELFKGVPKILNPTYKKNPLRMYYSKTNPNQYRIDPDRFMDMVELTFEDSELEPYVLADKNHFVANIASSLLKNPNFHVSWITENPDIPFARIMEDDGKNIIRYIMNYNMNANKNWIDELVEHYKYSSFAEYIDDKCEYLFQKDHYYICYNKLPDTNPMNHINRPDEFINYNYSKPIIQNDDNVYIKHVRIDLQPHIEKARKKMETDIATEILQKKTCIGDKFLGECIASFL